MKSFSNSRLFAWIGASALAVSIVCTVATAAEPTNSASATPEVAATHTNTAIVPRLNPGFMRRHNAFLPIAEQGDFDVLFMGDSITDFWRNEPRTNTPPGNPLRTNAPPPVPGAMAGKPVFDKYFGGWKVANFGIAGDTTEGVLWRLQNGEGQHGKPKAIMLMIGTNNTGKNSAEEIAEGVAAVVQELRKDFADAEILLLGIFPRTAPASARVKIAAINPIIAKLADGTHVFYMDIGSKFLDANGNIPRDIMSDGLHPTTKGYEIWADAVKDPLAKMLKGEAPTAN